MNVNAHALADAYVAVRGEDWPKGSPEYNSLVGYIQDNPQPYLDDDAVRGYYEATRPSLPWGWVTAAVLGIMLLRRGR